MSKIPQKYGVTYRPEWEMNYPVKFRSKNLRTLYRKKNFILHHQVFGSRFDESNLVQIFSEKVWPGGTKIQIESHQFFQRVSQLPTRC